jgi:hypothetical protein
MKNSCRKIFFVSVLFAFCAEVFPSGNAPDANRRTALRCLENATNYFAEKKWAEAKSQAYLGIAYDDSVSDLWYICGSSELAEKKSKAYVLPFLENALKLNDWANYNRDNARLLYADLLSDTGKFQEAVDVLDAAPLLYSSDAEFIRVKSYYRMKDDASVSRARNKIDGARRIYSSDTRFPLLFFKNENPDDTNADVKRIAAYFVNQISQYAQAAPDKDEELEIYAARFASGKEKINILKSFAARGLRHPLYAVESLKEKISGEQEAFDYVAQFADEKIDFDILNEFVSLLQDEDVIDYARQYFDSFCGFVVQDTDGDGIENLFVKFYRGRPQEISYDKNQDGEFDWKISCDFGVPISGFLRKGDMTFLWNDFPYLEQVEFFSAAKDSSRGTEKSIQKFKFISESIQWLPVKIQESPVISEKTGTKFFFPVLNDEFFRLTLGEMLDSSSSFELLADGADEKIRFVILNGKIQQSFYYSAEGKLFAQARFEDNLPVVRVVDSDRDGIFETTEFYAVDFDRSMKVHSLEDEHQIIQNLFGGVADGAEFYLRMIQVDKNNDTIPDFTEEYTSGGGKIISWDTDEDGKFNVRHVVFPGGVVEQSLFYTVPKGELVTVKFENKIPVQVTDGEEILSVYRDGENEFFWLTKTPEIFKDSAEFSAMAKSAKKILNEKNEQGSCVILEGEKQNVLCIRIENFDFGILTEKEDEKK